MVIRCWQRVDAALLNEAIGAGLDHLRPWLLWAESELFLAATALTARPWLIRSKRSTSPVPDC
jgi:hypothetical protein